MTKIRTYLNNFNKHRKALGNYININQNIFVIITSVLALVISIVTYFISLPERADIKTLFGDKVIVNSSNIIGDNEGIGLFVYIPLVIANLGGKPEIIETLYLEVSNKKKAMIY